MQNPSGIVLLPEAPATPFCYSSEFIRGRNNYQDKIYLRIVQPPAGELLYSATSEISLHVPPRYASLGFSRDNITFEGIGRFIAKLVQWRFYHKVEPAEARDLNYALCRKLEDRLFTPREREFRV